MLTYWQIPREAIAIVTYKDGSTENFDACINTSGEIEYLEKEKYDRRAGEHNRFHIEHLQEMNVRSIHLIATHEVESEELDL